MQLQWVCDVEDMSGPHPTACCRLTAVRGCRRGVNCSDGCRAALSHEVVQRISSPWHGNGSGSVDKVSGQQVFHVGGQKVRTLKEGSRRA